MSGHEHENDLTGGERELESALRAIRASRAGTPDPIACAFAAGRRSGATPTLVWKSASAALLVALAVMLLNPVTSRPSAGTASAVATQDVPAVVPPPSSNSGTSYYAIRAEVLSRGVDALALPSGSGSVDASRAPSLRRI